MSSRATIIGLLAQRVGFQFNEEELSPGLRRKVGELAELKQTIDFRRVLATQRQGEIVHLRTKKGNNTILLIILIIVGVLLLIIIIGVAPLIGAYFAYRERQKIDTRIQQANAEIATYNAEVAGMSSTMSSRLAALSQEIQGELSGIRGATPRQVEPFQPPPIADVIPARQPPPVMSGQRDNVQVIRETVREVVMIPCQACGFLMPQASLKCPNCGARKT